MNGDAHGWPTRTPEWPEQGRRSDGAESLGDAMRFTPGYMSSPPSGSQPPLPPFPQQQQQQQQQRLGRELSFEPPGAFGGFPPQQQFPPPHMQPRVLGESVFDLGGAPMSGAGLGFSLGPPLPGANLLSSSPLDTGTPLHGLGMAHSRSHPPPAPQSPQLGMPPPGSADLSGPQALYHLQFQQQRHQQQHQGHGPSPSQGFGLPSQQQQQSGPIGSRFTGLQQQQQQQQLPQHQPTPPPSQFDLSQSMLQMNLNGSTSVGGGGGGGGGGGFGESTSSLSSSGSGFDPFASWASASSSSASSSSSGVSLREQMNQQMAALYQRESTASSHSPLAPSGQGLVGLLSSSSRQFDSRNAFPDLPDLTSSQMLGAPPAAALEYQQQQQAYRGPQQPLSNSAMNNRQSRRSPAKPTSSYPNSRERESGGFSKNGRVGDGSKGSGDFASSIEVSPEMTKPNGNIKVQVSLLAEECSPGRVLMVGLFRGGQMTNERPIFVKQVLFENKLNRNYRFLNTRITFRAPRSPGEFEFRVFESKKSTNGLDDRENSSYSNVTIARSNKLKVNMEYSHFIETLRGTSDKLRNGMAEGDSGAIMSSLLSILRLVDQVETVFLHGNALFSDFVDTCLQLLSLNESAVNEMFAPTEAAPNPIESFHGTLRNVLNGIQANPFVRELIADDVLRKVGIFQRDFYCQASGFYFTQPSERLAYWQKHFGFTPFAFTSNDEQGQRLLKSAFVNEDLSQWIEQEAKQLIPEKDEFRRSRQEIYNVVHAQVVSRLPIKADLDVFGSSANDFGTTTSDMDMCLVLEKQSVSVEEKQQVLRVVVALLERQPHLFTDIDASRLTARIPIVMFRMKESGTECDLCVENVLAQRNTAFLRAYANADARVRVVAYVLKRFVKARRMNSPAEGTLSSYGYLLMLIHYLQRQDPPVLPVLQSLSPAWDGSSKCDCSPTRVWCSLQSPQCSLSERHPEMRLPSVLGKGPADDNETASSRSAEGKVETYFFDPFAFQDPPQKLQLLHAFGARNRASVGELLIGFFEYFGLVFDASRQVVSVRMARNLSKEEKKRASQWRMHTRLSIEDPFEIGYDVAHVLKSSRDKYIRQQFAWAYTRLVQGSLDAESETTKDSGESVARIMAILNEEVQEPAFLQSGANVTAAVAGDNDDDDDGSNGHAEGHDQGTSTE